MGEGGTNCRITKHVPGPSCTWMFEPVVGQFWGLWALLLLCFVIHEVRSGSQLLMKAAFTQLSIRFNRLGWLDSEEQEESLLG